MKSEHLRAISNLDRAQRRLIVANLRRRHRFQYAQKHASRLSARQLESIPAIPDIPRPKPTEPKELEPLDKTGDTPPNAVDTQQRPTAHSERKTDTTVSGIQPSGINLTPNSATQSQRVRTEISTTASKVEYPKPPKDAQKERPFRCPCCCQMIPAMFAEPERWK